MTKTAIRLRSTLGALADMLKRSSIEGTLDEHL